MWKTFVESIENVNNTVNLFIWGIPVLTLIVFTGVMMTLRTGFFQIKHCKEIYNNTFKAIFKNKSVTNSSNKKAISQFQALSTALAATIGTGNIAGVATAIAFGGPGAVFWMWISAVFGMMTIYSENVLGIYYRKKNQSGEWSGGAMYYLQYGLGSKEKLKKMAKVLAILFAIFCVLASFGIGNMTQSNSIADAMNSNFNISPAITGAAIAVVVSLVILGGLKRIGSVTEKIVPFMSAIYIIGTLAIFFANYEQIPYVFKSIFYGAFNFSAIGGGVFGYVIKRAMMMGIKRGVFSNEAGLGSTVLINSSSDVKEPVIQGMWGIFEVFFDTILVCTLTAFVLLSSSTNVKTKDEVFANITTNEQIFNISKNVQSGDFALIDSNDNLIPIVTDSTNQARIYTAEQINYYRQSATSDEDIKEFIPIRAYGNTYYVEAKNLHNATEEDFIYTNVMKIKAIPMTDKDGEILYDDKGNKLIGEVVLEQVNGVSLVSYAFCEKFGGIAGKILAIEILLFAFSTLLGWSFYGTKSVEYLLGTKYVFGYKCLFIVFIILGSTMNLNLVWSISDTLNGFMALPNLIGVISLSGLVIKITKNYFARKKDSTIRPMYSNDEDIQRELENNT